MEFGQLQRSSGKSKKLKFDGLLFYKKYILLAKTLYTEDLSNITLKYLCENSPNFLCHFGNHKSFSDTTPLYFFSSNITILSKKVAHRSANFHTFHYCVKIHQNLSCHFSNKKLVFFSKFGSHFSIMRDNSSVPF